jgi:hypothetical protein
MEPAVAVLVDLLIGFGLAALGVNDSTNKMSKCNATLLDIRQQKILESRTFRLFQTA